MAIRRLGRTVWALGLTSLLTDLGTEMIFPLLPLFLTQTLGAGAEALGLIEGAADALAALLKLGSGYLLERWPRAKALALTGYSISSAVRPLVAIAAAPFHVLAVRLGDRVGKGLRGTARDALLSEAAPAGETGRVFGFDRSMDHLGALVGPLLASALLGLGHLGLRSVFAISVVPGALAVLALALGVRRDPPRIARAEPLSVDRAPLPPRFWSYLAIAGLFALANSSDAFLLLRAQELGVAAAALPLVWVVLHLSKMASAYPLGGLSDRVGRLPTLLTGYLWYALSYGAFALARGPGAAWLLFAIYGVFYGLTEGVGKALVADLLPAERRASGFGLYNGATGFLSLPAGLAMGFVWHRAGGPAALLFAAVLAALAALGLLAFGALARLDER